MPKSKKPLTKEDIDGPNPVTKAFKKRALTVEKLVGNLWEIAQRKEEVEGKQGETKKLQSAAISRVNVDATVQLCKLEGLFPAEKVGLDGDIIVNIQATPIEKKREK